VVKVGLAAFGMSGRVFHAPLIARHPHFSLSAVCERHGDTARQRHPGVRRARSFDDLLADASLEVVVVNTPDATHHALARQALEAGRHVVVEKPFTGRIGEAQDLAALAVQKGRLLAVFHNRRWDGDFLTVLQLLARGALGRLVECEMRWDRFRPEVAPESWKENAAGESGTLNNLGSHLVDQALVLFGWPQGVTARLSALRDGAEVDDWIDVRLHYPRLEVALKASYVARAAGPRFVLHGTEGSFVKHGVDPQEAALAAGERPDAPGWGEEPPAAWRPS
jgi:predicted dehydrogenase